jgi:hypothetical protein
MLLRAALMAFVGVPLFLLWVVPAGEADAQGANKGKPAAEAAGKAVKEDLAKFMARDFVMQEVQDAAVGRAFPQYLFFSVYFRQYPVARLTPKGLSNANVYAVGPEGKPNLIKEAARLQDFFKATLAPVQDDNAAKDAARSYVRLLEDLHQDGFYKFALQDDSTRVEASPNGKKASARAVVMAGGNGELSAVLTFDQTGRPQTITENILLKPGPRPICQATKLLDKDQIVRSMAEQDLLIMGAAAGAYLEEQRRQAAPELQRAIDRIWRRILAEGQ